MKVKALYLTSVVPSVTKLVSMEADGAPFIPSLCQCSVLRVFESIERFHVTLRQPCWCSKLILWDLNSMFMFYANSFFCFVKLVSILVT